jgi:hypothetical protein
MKCRNDIRTKKKVKKELAHMNQVHQLKEKNFIPDQIT